MRPAALASVARLADTREVRGVVVTPVAVDVVNLLAKRLSADGADRISTAYRRPYPLPPCAVVELTLFRIMLLPYRAMRRAVAARNQLGAPRLRTWS